MDFAAHARSLGAHAEQVKTIGDLEGALERARRADRTAVVVIETDPARPFTGRRGLVGRPGAGGLGRARRSARRARRTSRRAAASGREASVTVRIGVNPIGWTNDDLETLGDDTPLEACLAEARQAGYAGIELGRKFPRRPAELRAVLAAARARPRVGLVRLPAPPARARRRRSPRCRRTRASWPSWARTAMVFAEETDSVHGRLGVPLSTRPRAGRGGLAALRRGADRGRRAPPRARDAARVPPPHGDRRRDGGRDRPADGGDRPRGGPAPATPATSPTRAATCWPSRAGTRAGSSTSTARTSGRPCSRRRAGARPELPRRGGRRRVHRARRRLRRLPGAARVLRDAGYAGWLVVEAEQDPAKAHPLTYARMGFAHLSRLLADLRL